MRPIKSSTSVLSPSPPIQMNPFPRPSLPFPPFPRHGLGTSPFDGRRCTSILSSHSSRTHPSSASDGSTLPFGLYPNLLTSAIGVATFIALWPLLVVLHWTGAEEFTLPADGRTWASIAGIALGGVTFNSGYMVRCVATHPVNVNLTINRSRFSLEFGDPSSPPLGIF
jgi:hypothetical protein